MTGVTIERDDWNCNEMTDLMLKEDRRFMRVLVACEFSGTVRDAFIKRGHNAISCDLLPSDAPGPHIEGDVLPLLDNYEWDLLVAHPPCTYLANSGAKHLYKGMKKENGPDKERWHNMSMAAIFFYKLWTSNVPAICVENPIMHGHAKRYIGIRAAPSQIIQPWQYGHKELKATCLWTKGLPALTPSDVVGPPPKDEEGRKKWAVVHRMPPSKDRGKLRSITYQGIADAMAEQWT